MRRLACPPPFAIHPLNTGSPPSPQRPQLLLLPRRQLRKQSRKPRVHALLPEEALQERLRLVVRVAPLPGHLVRKRHDVLLGDAEAEGGRRRLVLPLAVIVVLAVADLLLVVEPCVPARAAAAARLPKLVDQHLDDLERHGHERVLVRVLARAAARHDDVALRHEVALDDHAREPLVVQRVQPRQRHHVLPYLVVAGERGRGVEPLAHDDLQGVPVAAAAATDVYLRQEVDDVARAVERQPREHHDQALHKVRLLCAGDALRHRLQQLWQIRAQAGGAGLLDSRGREAAHLGRGVIVDGRVEQAVDDDEDNLEARLARFGGGPGQKLRGVALEYVFNGEGAVAEELVVGRGKDQAV